MNCDICFAAFDNSIHKPYSIVSVVPNIDSSKSLVCLHTYCLSCWDQMSLTLKRCPKCNKLIKGKTLNTELLKQLPESEYDKIKDSSLKTFDESIVHLNELKQSIKVNREQKLKQHETQIDLVKKIITDETLKLISYLKQNEENLLNECDQNLKELPVDLDSNKYENNVLFQIDLSSREKIVKNELSKDELNELTNKIAEIKEKLNATLNVVNIYEKPFNFIPNKISNDDLLIGQIKLEFVNTIINFFYS